MNERILGQEFYLNLLMSPVLQLKKRSCKAIAYIEEIGKNYTASYLDVQFYSLVHDLLKQIIIISCQNMFVLYFVSYCFCGTLTKTLLHKLKIQTYYFNGNVFLLIKIILFYFSFKFGITDEGCE